MKVVLTIIAIICIIIGLSEVLRPKTDFWIKCFDKSLTKYKKSAFIQAHSIASIIGGVLLMPLAFEMASPELWVILEVINLIAFWSFVRSLLSGEILP